MTVYLSEYAVKPLALAMGI